jgi:hypothetical protein
MVPPTTLYINQNLIIQQISATMNYESKSLFTIKDKYNNKNKKGLYIEIVEDIFIDVYFPDGVWTHIKEYLFNPVITDLVKQVQELDQRKWIFADELRRMTFQSTEYNLQRDILFNTCRIRDIYQLKIKHLVRQDRPTHK